MGDLGHSIPSVNCRKRKAGSDEECQDSVVNDPTAPCDDMLVDSAVAPRRLPNAPRQPPSSPWLSTDTAHAVWPSEPSPTDTPPVSPLTPVEPPQDAPSRFNKRPRIETESLVVSPSRTQRRSSEKPSSSRSFRPSIRRSRKSEPRDTGGVFHNESGSVSSTPLRVESNCSGPDCPHHPLPTLPPIDLNSSHIPSMYPLINRQTLKELDLGAILRNPQLRHDLLFDAGLQFRPTSGRRKRDLADRYWRAITLELETGCTCVSFDLQGKPHDCVCVCRRVPNIPSQNPILTYSASRRVLTLRMPSRIRLLLPEFLEVLLYVIQPLSSISGTYANPATFQKQIDQHAAQASHLRSVFDPELIQQELQHELYDPSGLFAVIGKTLKSHCAPMRDRAVDAMVDLAQTCAPSCGGTKMDAIKAVRMCLDILELMKLDIANHQLQTLRPFLIDSSGQYELKTFKGRRGHASSLVVTQKWLQTAHQQLLTTKLITYPSCPSGSINYPSLASTQQAYLSVLKGLTDLVFNPPSTPPSIQPPHNSLTSVSPLPLYPETTYLDSARLLVLATDAADTTAMYMFLLLYRQLVFSDAATSATASRDPSKVSDGELLKLKKEIRDVSSSHLGNCFKFGCSELDASQDEERVKWQKIKQDVVLQVAVRAKAAELSKSSASLEAEASITLPSAPDERILKLAERWSDTNMQPKSMLSVMSTNRIRDAVFNLVASLTFPFPSRESSTAQCRRLELNSFPTATSSVAVLATGMEPLKEEIRSLAERLSRLAQIHLGVYLPLYEQEGFLTGSSNFTSP
ncbi:Tcp11-domain-containing protein [Leucogyrophana mollusca]|uniref:Tcp11-domain-containing protein n=1 Tax=Leucogyrophana mollusca TaxID=85980 RepID=A0ACB8B7Y9_9AGAM|nr:Tcp11-domain-containing protein [Leucogyrophana mollusca]